MGTGITAMGELLADLTACGTNEDGFPVFSAHPGGAPANFLAAAAADGTPAAMIGKVGADAFGRMLKEELRRRGVRVSGVIEDPDVFTTLAFVTVGPDGSREFSFARKPGADTCLRPEETDMSLIARSAVFHFGTLSLTDEPSASALKAATAEAKRLGVAVSVDPNYRPALWPDGESARTAMEWALGQADIVKISGEELRFLRDAGPEEGAERLLNEGARLVFVTLGADGCFAANARASVRLPVPAGLKAADTTGAGDIFGGTAVSRFLKTGKKPEELEREELEDIARYANAAAALSVMRPGGMGSVPSPEEVAAVLRTGGRMR